MRSLWAIPGAIYLGDAGCATLAVVRRLRRWRMPESDALRLKLRDPDGQEREVSFTQDVVTIGRSHECDLPLESGFISRNHARLSFMGSGASGGGGWQIVDEGSKNGVFVNGQRIAGSTAVKPGDALRIGDYRVSVLPVESETPAEDSDID